MNASPAHQPPALEHGRLRDLPPWAQEQLNRARQEAGRYRRRVRELEAQDHNHDEATRAAMDRATAAESARDALQVRVHQLTAAVRYGITDLSLIALLAGSPEEIDQAAAALARHLPATP